MPITTFPEYARAMQDVLDAVAATGEANVVSIRKDQRSLLVLIFRYDNAAHRPPLPQAEHKHTPAGVEVSLAPTLAQVIDEILKGG
jgi:hypothetical protein